MRDVLDEDLLPLFDMEARSWLATNGTTIFFREAEDRLLTTLTLFCELDPTNGRDLRETLLLLLDSIREAVDPFFEDIVETLLALC